MNDAATSLYEPLNQYKPIAHNIGIVDGPFEYMSLLGMRLPWPFTTRMTVVRFPNGDLFLHSPIAFDAALAKRMQSMGVIKHLISPNKLHYAHIGEWALAFPNAVTWASPHVRNRARSQRLSVNFNRDLAPGAPAEWNDEIDQILIPGGVFEEIVFFHRESKTLILADTIMNFELDKIGQPWRLIAKLTGTCYPSGQMPLDMRLSFLPRKRQVCAAFEKILAWKPERIILSHGRCFDSNGSTVLRRAFRWAL